MRPLPCTRLISCAQGIETDVALEDVAFADHKHVGLLVLRKGAMAQASQERERSPSS